MEDSDERTGDQQRIDDPMSSTESRHDALIHRQAGAERLCAAYSCLGAMRQMNTVARMIDKTLEGTVAPSFTRIGIDVRKRLFDWKPLESFSMTGKTVAITGVTSGIGRAAVDVLTSLDANLVLIGRDEAKMQKVQSELHQRTGEGSITYALADLGDLDQVRAAAAVVAERHHRLDGLIHNAGALFNERRTADDGMELTTKVQVVAPFLLTSLLMQNLTAAGGRVVTMSSGGMYTAGLTVNGLQMSEDNYSGTQQYARTKRAQVTLSEMWAQRHGDSGVVFHALHPGWVDTPGVSSALPGFGKVLGPLLRTPAQGADTLVWLVAAPVEALQPNGSFWHDRQVRPIHRLSSTRRTDTQERREELWKWTADAARVPG